MNESKIDVAARKIANQIVFGKIEAAKIMWANETIPMMRWEMQVLRDKIRSISAELEAAKRDLQAKKNAI